MQRNDNFSFTLLLSKQLFHRMSMNTSGPSPDLFKDKKLSVDTLSKAQIQTITDFLFNPLSPKSDQREISPYNVNALVKRVVMRIEHMNHGR